MAEKLITYKLITLNVNGINSEKKQKLLFEFIKSNNYKIICLQEHNIKDKSKLMSIFHEHFDIQQYPPLS